MTRPRRLTVLVDLEVLIAPEQEAPMTRAICASVSSAVGSAVLGAARWEETTGGEDLVEQWRIEQRGAPLAGRRARRFTMSARAVRADDGADVLDEIQRAAIGAVCPTARDEERRIDAGERVPFVADALPWSGGAHIADDAGAVDEAGQDHADGEQPPDPVDASTPVRPVAARPLDSSLDHRDQVVP